MNEEERQRQMDFILTQQAQFAAGIQRLQEGHERLQEGHEKLQEAHARGEARLDRLERVVGLMARAGLRARRQLGALEGTVSVLVGVQLQTQEAVLRNSEDINRLTEIVRQLAAMRNGGNGEMS